MKKNLLLLFAGLSLAFTSCGDSAPESNLEETQHDADQIADGQADGVVEFNDGIVAHVDMGELQMAKLMDLDDQDVPAAEMLAAANEAMADVEQRIKTLEALSPTGIGGDDFLSSAIDHLKNVKAVAEVYAEFSNDLETPDSLWTEDMGAMWMNLAEPIFADYEDSYTQLEISQGTYGSLNNMDIIPSDVTIEDLYEESK
ncbi:MAG: hypothetical protein H6599_05935 [Flavobacteriales bacterium]|nr:hypothetical protein [Flavobacteriales bacterium]